MKKRFFVGIALCVAAGLGYIGYLWYEQGAVVEGTLIERTFERDVPKGFKEYRSTMYNFSLLYPELLAMREFDEGGGAVTITFQNPEAGTGFQLFVVPYVESTISEERFLRDVPSGVRTYAENTFVGGVPAVTFLSRDQLLGETREVWFIHNGYLYEVTTLKDVGEWFVPIMQSWWFL
jgi:hypothetical protein